MPIFSLIIALALLTFFDSQKLILGHNSVGKACNTDIDCTGANEFCRVVDWLVPSCVSKGICQCKSCYTTGDYSGFSWGALTQLPCAPAFQLNFGEQCFGVYNEQYPSRFAECIDGKVTCLPGYNCASDGISRILSEDGSCAGNQNCPGEMKCNNVGKCSCPNFYEYFDNSTGLCRKRDLGHYCQSDDQCKVSGRHWNGFTWDSAACLNQTCQCSKGSVETLASFLDPTSGKLTTKRICSVKASKVALEPGSICHVDPVYFSDSDKVRICGQDSVCISCPGDDPSWVLGRCRKLVDPQLDLCPSDFGPKFNETCSENYPCRGVNQICEVDLCRTRRCKCKAGFIWQDGACVSKPQLKLGEACQQHSMDVYLLPPHSVCQNSRVTCNQYHFEQNGECAKIQRGSFGSPCNALYPCLGYSPQLSAKQLWCDDRSKTCQCYDGDTSKWNDLDDRCHLREWGDPCTSNAQCETFGSLLEGGYTYGGGYCSPLTSKCDCRPGQFVKVNFTFFRQNDGDIFMSKTICVHKSAKLNVDLGGSCALDPIKAASNQLGQTRVCRDGAFCVRCETDFKVANLPRTQGICQMLN